MTLDQPDIDAVRIIIPVPPPQLSPNWRGHWAVRDKARKSYRQSAYVAGVKAVREAKGAPNWQTATAQATFYHATRRKRDGDNLLASLKAAFDGLADAGIIRDDSGLTHLPVVQDRDKERPRVEILVRGTDQREQEKP